MTAPSQRAAASLPATPDSVLRSGDALEECQEVARIGAWELDLRTQRLRWSLETYRIHEVSPETYTPELESAIAFYAPEAIGKIRLAVSTAIADGTPYDVEVPLVTARGRRIWVRSRGRPEFRDGAAVRLYGSFQDITDRREMEHRHRAFMTNAPVLAWVADPRGRLLYYNPPLAAFFGYPPNESGRHDRPNPFPPAPEEPGAAPVNPAATNHEVRLVAGADGTRAHLLVCTFPVDGIDPGEVGGVALDITEQQRTLEELQESRRTLATLLANLPGMAYRCRYDKFWTMEFSSQGCREVTGYDCGDLLHNRRHSFSSLILPQDRRMVRETVDAAVRTRGPFELTYRIRHADGGIRWLWERGRPVFAPDGAIEALEGFVTDVTSQHLDHQVLLAQAELLEKANDSILVVDLRRRVRFCNPRAGRFFGPPGTAVAWKDLHPDAKPAGDNHFSPWSRTLARGSWTGECLRQSTEGAVSLFESSWTLLRNTGDQPDAILIIETDITDKKKLETQIIQAQRLESIGVMAGGIAHDLNNILSPILLATDLLKTAGLSPKEERLLDFIAKSAERGGEVVRQVLAFARGTGGRRTVSPPDSILREVASIVRETFPRNLRLETTIEPALPPIRADLTQIHQVLLNLAVNARDAMPDGGTLRLGLDLRRLSGDEVAGQEAVRPGSFVRFTVADTGAGIREEIQDKIFDPFFTTKEIGKGTGLGLATARTIARNHSGFVDFQSCSSEGTVFHLYLPVHDTSKATPASSRGQSSPA
ncbi:MAG: PAS domain S-box protein [Puniceicoccaceae bacterium]|nr:MAG: PAS domain S-box protein [Puniceicoccaceae bacterium]